MRVTPFFLLTPGDHLTHDESRKNPRLGDLPHNVGDKPQRNQGTQRDIEPETGAGLSQSRGGVGLQKTNLSAHLTPIRGLEFRVGNWILNWISA